MTYERIDTPRTLDKRWIAHRHDVEPREDTMTSIETPIHTPPRSFRAPDELWQAAKWLATARRETLSDVLNVALAQYVLEGMTDTSDKLTDVDRQALHRHITEDEVKRIIRRRTP